MTFKLFAAAALAATLAQPSLAQTAEPFSGFHAGIEGGWSRVGGGVRKGSDGFVYGGSLGYDFALDKVRIGPDVEITGSTQKICYPMTVGGVPGAGTTCQRTDRDLYVGGRLGYVVAPSVMLYAKAGYSNARYGEFSEPGGWRARDHDGYRVGAGAEYEFLGRFFVNAEYRYSHYTRDIHQNQILGGVGVRF